MLDLKLKDKIPCSEIRKRTKIIDIIEYTLKQKVEMGRPYSKIRGQKVDKAMRRVASQGEGRGREDDQAEDGKMT